MVSIGGLNAKSIFFILLLHTSIVWKLQKLRLKTFYVHMSCENNSTGVSLAIFCPH